MEKLSSLTIINDKNLRGVLAPAKLLSKELFEDMLDLILYSRPGVAAKINRDFKKVKKLMRSPIVVDGRNIYNRSKLRKLGFVYEGIGR